MSTEISTPDSQPEELSMSELQAKHDTEAAELGWKSSFKSGEVQGDVIAEILPYPPELVDGGAVPRYYLYRRNPITGRYRLVQSS